MVENRSEFYHRTFPVYIKQWYAIDRGYSLQSAFIHKQMVKIGPDRYLEFDFDSKGYEVKSMNQQLIEINPV